MTFFAFLNLQKKLCFLVKQCLATSVAFHKTSQTPCFNIVPICDTHLLLFSFEKSCGIESRQLDGLNCLTKSNFALVIELFLGDCKCCIIL